MTAEDRPPAHGRRTLFDQPSLSTSNSNDSLSLDSAQDRGKNPFELTKLLRELDVEAASHPPVVSPSSLLSPSAFPSPTRPSPTRTPQREHKERPFRHPKRRVGYYPSSPHSLLGLPELLFDSTSTSISTSANTDEQEDGTDSPGTLKNDETANSYTYAQAPVKSSLQAYPNNYDAGSHTPTGTEIAAPYSSGATGHGSSTPRALYLSTLSTLYALGPGTQHPNPTTPNMPHSDYAHHNKIPRSSYSSLANSTPSSYGASSYGTSSYSTSLYNTPPYNVPLYGTPPYASGSGSHYPQTPYTSGSGSQYPQTPYTRGHIAEPRYLSDESRASTEVLSHGEQMAAADTSIKQCYNCGKTSTPLWRCDPTTQRTLCNACGLYQQQRHAPRPQALIDADNDEDEDEDLPIRGDGPQCSECGTRKTSVWRRNKDGEQVCNACGIYYRVNGRPRPNTMIAAKAKAKAPRKRT
ncbi:hypothetical protein K438DRAFT_70449 [Mycena galopus ATCC 62051]|nr:hypothetical protein K438DRAFT_70449 [Mycena galopus ATCC 62051]